MQALWNLLALPGGTVLEIGPGSGHLLAAARQAGCSVAAVESSKVHRDFIRDVWGIESVYAGMDELPDGRTFDTVLAINVFEHIYDIPAFLSAVRRVLAPGGICYLSTPNALSLEASLLRTWWSMCKVHDHVSFPSAAGLATAALESDLRVGRIWSTGLPFEFPVSALTSARDRVQARHLAGRHPAGGNAPGSGQPGTVATDGAVRAGGTASGKAALARFYSMAALFDPGYRVLGALGRAGSLKAKLTR
jgi:2-polyprenyl-6-hydroxyphenyl methylase/3-demethylubiquinone-9 3-methyltransferase